MNGGVPSILVVAGEISGDMHAGNLLRELARLVSGVESFGVGGEALEAAGLDLVAHTGELAHMGLVEVIREIPRIRGIMARLVAEAAARKPAVAVLVDSPDFNLRLAARLRRLGIPVVLYVSPQIWAWRRRRVRLVRRVAREVLCILPFEVEFYARSGVRARYVGHPLVDDLAREGLEPGGTPGDPSRLALLPGSREMEVRQLLPAMMGALHRLPPDRVREAVLLAAPGVEGVIASVLGELPPEARLRVVTGRERRVELARSGLALTASGTATLECALLDVPMIVGYRLQGLSYLMARMMVRVPHIALVNLIAGTRAAPELLQEAWCPGRIAEEVLGMLGGGADRQREHLELVRRCLGGPGASRRAAEAVAGYLAEGAGS